jgi:hypothetical protein
VTRFGLPKDASLQVSLKKSSLHVTANVRRKAESAESVNFYFGRKKRVARNQTDNAHATGDE